MVNIFNTSKSALVFHKSMLSDLMTFFVGMPFTSMTKLFSEAELVPKVEIYIHLQEIEDILPYPSMP